MATHEFGIMHDDPKAGDRFDSYTPEKYELIQVDDELIEPLLDDLNNIDFYWHTLDVLGKGLAYTGITLIPPKSAKLFASIIEDDNLSQLKNLLIYAFSNDKFIIHYGL